jgi:deoxyadenosine/deoxycytidine kinase
MFASRKIIALDGNVYTGKTSLINEFSKKKTINVLPEYASFFNETEFRYLSPIEIQHKYLEAEKIRKSKLSFKKNTLLDRSIISQAGFVYASYKQGNFDLRKEFLYSLKQMQKNNELIIPHHFVHIKCDFKILKKRYIEEEKSENAKNTDCKLLSKEYCFLLDEFLSKFADFTINTTNLTVVESKQKLIDFISHEGKPSDEDIIKKIEYLLSD